MIANIKAKIHIFNNITTDPRTRTNLGAKMNANERQYSRPHNHSFHGNLSSDMN